MTPQKRKMSESVAALQQQLEVKIASVTPSVTSRLKVGNPQALTNNPQTSLNRQNSGK